MAFPCTQRPCCVRAGSIIWGKWVTFTRTRSVRWLPWDMVRLCGFHTVPGSLWDVASGQTHQKSGGIETS